MKAMLLVLRLDGHDNIDLTFVELSERTLEVDIFRIVGTVAHRETVNTTGEAVEMVGAA